MVVGVVLHFENLKKVGIYAHNQLEVCFVATSEEGWQIGHTSCDNHKRYSQQHGPTPNPSVLQKIDFHFIITITLYLGLFPWNPRPTQDA